MRRLLLVALLAIGCGEPALTSSSPSSSTSRPTPATVASSTPRPPGASITPFALERAGYGTALEAVDVPAGRYRYTWTATGECEYAIRLGKRVDGEDAPAWLVEIATDPGRDDGGGEFDLAESAGILLTSGPGAGCAWSFALVSA